MSSADDKNTAMFYYELFLFAAIVSFVLRPPSICLDASNRVTCVEITADIQGGGSSLSRRNGRPIFLFQPEKKRRKYWRAEIVSMRQVVNWGVVQ